MEKGTEANQRTMKKAGKNMKKAILLLDRYDTDAHMLYESFGYAKRKIKAIVINSEGFLPDGVLSPFEYFLGDYSKDKRFKGSPLYFNEVEIPEYWKIRADSHSGTVFNVTKSRAVMSFTDTSNKRLVKTVDWYDERGVVRSTDHYNQYGALYARTIHDIHQNPIVKSYFSVDGREVISENFVTKNIILTELEDGIEKTHIFSDRTEFVSFFLKQVGHDKDTFYYNSLGIPFLVSLRLRDRGSDDILFWQEAARKDVPGNMQMILEGKVASTSKILVQHRTSYDAFVKAGIKSDRLLPFGYVYDFAKQNTYSNEALICTNSDTLEQIDMLASELPEIHFNIVAKTEMSEKLMAKEEHENITLYPVASDDMISTLYKKCDWYFDINYGSEVSDAVYQAFLHNHIIFAFNETRHNPDYTCKEHICGAESGHLIILAIKAMLDNKDVIDQEVGRQHDFAMSEPKERYKEY